MKIVSFVEGATIRKGGLGLVGVPMILSSTAARGHQCVLVIAGPINPGREVFETPDVESALLRPEGKGTFGIVRFNAWSNWAFAPMILWRLKNAVRDADAVTLHSMYSFPVLAGYMLARFYGKPFGIWPHGVFAPFQRQISSFKKWLYDHLIGRRILSKASVIFYSAAGERDETSPLRLAAPSVIVPHGMDWKEFLHLPPKGIFRKRYFPGFDGELVVFLARLNAKKGLDILIKAMSKVIAAKPNTRLAIIGPPDPASFGHKVEQWVNDEGIGASVVITGAIVNEAKREALADADVFVLASQAENFGFSVFEAMASRVPVVVSNTLNYAEEIARAGAGISIERTPGDCAEAIVRLLDDSDLRHRMGQAGAVLARSYSWDATGERVERTFDCVFRNIPLPSDLTEVKLGVSRG